MSLKQETEDVIILDQGENDRVRAIAIGDEKLWTNFALEQPEWLGDGQLTASEASAWSIVGNGSGFTRVNGNTEYRLAGSSSLVCMCVLDLFDYVDSGAVVNLVLDITAVDAGDTVQVVLDDNPTNFGANVSFPGSPYGSGDTGVKSLFNQTIDSTTRYLKLTCGINERAFFTDILMEYTS